MEIATAFLIKSVTESVKQMKLLLVASFETVTKSHSRTGFNDLLASTTQMFKNISRFEDSVSLVITKVDPSKIVRGEIITDLHVKRSTAQFITEHRLFLEAKGPAESDKIKLIDALLKQSSNGDYQKMSIFWQPKQIGPFNTIDKFINGRRLIRQSVIQHSSYADVKHNELDFSLTPEAKISVARMILRTIDNIKMILSKLNTQLLADIQNRINMTRGFKKKLNLIEIGRDCLQSIQNSTTLDRRQLTDVLIKLFNIYYLTTDMRDFNLIKRHESNLITLESIRGSDSNANSSNIIQRIG